MRHFWLAGLGIAAALTVRVEARAQEFDHLPHQRMFPTCESCHQVEPAAVTMPEPTLCGACHNGQTVRRVDWQGPSARPSNLAFNHASVFEAKEDALGMELPCGTCHVQPGAERMDVSRVVLEGCLGCHAPGKQHRVDASCDQCHVALMV